MKKEANLHMDDSISLLSLPIELLSNIIEFLPAFVLASENECDGDENDTITGNYFNFIDCFIGLVIDDADVRYQLYNNYYHGNHRFLQTITNSSIPIEQLRKEFDGWLTWQSASLVDIMIKEQSCRTRYRHFHLFRYRFNGKTEDTIRSDLDRIIVEREINGLRVFEVLSKCSRGPFLLRSLDDVMINWIESKDVIIEYFIDHFRNDLSGINLFCTSRLLRENHLDLLFTDPMLSSLACMDEIILAHFEANENLTVVSRFMYPVYSYHYNQMVRSTVPLVVGILNNEESSEAMITRFCRDRCLITNIAYFDSRHEVDEYNDETITTILLDVVRSERVAATKVLKMILKSGRVHRYDLTIALRILSCDVLSDWVFIERIEESKWNLIDVVDRLQTLSIYGGDLYSVGDEWRYAGYPINHENETNSAYSYWYTANRLLEDDEINDPTSSFYDSTAIDINREKIEYVWNEFVVKMWK